MHQTYLFDYRSTTRSAADISQAIHNDLYRWVNVEPIDSRAIVKSDQFHSHLPIETLISTIDARGTDKKLQLAGGGTLFTFYVFIRAI